MPKEKLDHTSVATVVQLSLGRQHPAAERETSLVGGSACRINRDQPDVSAQFGQLTEGYRVRREVKDKPSSVYEVEGDVREENSLPLQ